MPPQPIRGIAVADVGYTSTKLALFSPAGELVTERRVPSNHHEGPPYRWIDPEPTVEFFRQTIAEFDAILPVDAIVPTAHGAAVALIAEDGSLALPIMDYTSEPPADIVAAYRQRMPPFAECLCPLLPMSLTHALQVFWQSRAHPRDFARTRTIVPWIQYVGFRLCGRLVTEVTSMSCQTQLVDPVKRQLSSLVKAEGWQRLFPSMVPAWEIIGDLKPEFGAKTFRGRGKVLAGAHDSSASYARYLAAGFGSFTLLSTGTWSICYDTSTTADQLDETRDTCINADIFGRQVAVSRFFGGKEYELVAGDAAATAPDLAMVSALIERGCFALPSFSGSSGPMPGSAGKGRIDGDAPANPVEMASLATLYCALMVGEQLDALSSRNDIIVDGPFARNAVLLALIAQLRPGQKVKASLLLDGTAAGAACLAMMSDGKLPHIPIETTDIVAADIAGLDPYRRRWRELSRMNSGPAPRNTE
ncbi:MAG: FGGY family carbohydrate kinase [Bauldia sp.]